MAFPLLSNPMPLDTDAFHYRGLTAASPAMRRVFSLLERLERSREAVLVSGEVGVGKERVARAIHDASPVSGGAFVVLDAGALAAAASEGQIDATAEIASALERAREGTLFVREVELLPDALQRALLQHLGTVGAKVRVLSSTTRSLEDDAQQGRFVAELYDRLATVRLFVPPLRHRQEDVSVLARTFAAEIGARALAPSIVADLAARTWPGNISELRQTVAAMVNERAVRESGVVPAPDDSCAPTGLDEALEALVDISVPYVDLKEQLVARFTRIYLARLLAHTKGNRSEAARIARLDRTYLGRLVGKLGVPVP